VVDAGDAFSPTPVIPSQRREAMVATAELIVDQYGLSGVAAMTVGDRDLALGRETLLALAARAKFPVISANLVDAASGERLLPDHVIVERAGLKVGIVGLMSPSGAANTALNRPSAEGEPSWRVSDPVVAARAAVTALAREGADLVVALSHLSPEEQAAVATAVPSIHVFLGGQSMGGRGSTAAAPAGAVAVEAGMKGKQVGLMTLHLDAGTPTNAPIVNKGQKQALEDRLARARVRADSLEKRLAAAKAAADAPTGGDAKGTTPRRRIPPPTALWEQQLAGTRAEIQMAEADLATLSQATPVRGNTASYELVNLGNDVVDDATVKSAVDAFRERYPDPTKAHTPARPVVRHPTQGRGVQAPTLPGRVTAPMVKPGMQRVPKPGAQRVPRPDGAATQPR
jgi:2',3'-cyclic-nucleotide 2'-phosphodiesterase (5'-nucleotidase family)